IKPANLLLTADGRVVKILDLGLARLHTAEGEQPSVGELTHTGVVMGTPDYMAPEQALDSHEVDTRADIYSLGCSLYYLLTANPPFRTGAVAQKLLWHQTVTPEPVENQRDDLSPELVAVVRKMMAKTPDERYQTPGEAAEALAAAASAAVRPPMARTPAPAGGEKELGFSFAESGVSVGSAFPKPGDATSPFPLAKRSSLLEETHGYAETPSATDEYGTRSPGAAREKRDSGTSPIKKKPKSERHGKAAESG